MYKYTELGQCNRFHYSCVYGDNDINYMGRYPYVWQNHTTVVVNNTQHATAHISNISSMHYYLYKPFNFKMKHMATYFCHVIWYLDVLIGCSLAVMTTTRFSSSYGNDVRSTMTSLYSVYVRSAIDCSMTCKGESSCRGVNYVKGTGYCELIGEYTAVDEVETSAGTRYLAAPGKYIIY